MTSAENPNPVDNQVKPQADQIQTELSYQRADGTIEIALSPEEAIARCPYLGRLPLEQANVLLELSRKGQEMIAEAETQAEVIKPDGKAPLIKTKEQSPVVTKPTKSEALDIINTTITPETTIVHQEEYIKPEVAVASKELDAVLKMVADTLLTPKNEHHDSVTKDLEADAIDKIVSENVISIKPVLPTATPAEIAQASPKAETTQVVEAASHEVEIPAEEALPAEDLAGPTVHELKPDLEQPEPRNELVIQQVSEALVINHEQAEFDTKPKHALEQLIEMLGLPEADFIAIDITVPPLSIESSEQESYLENKLDTVFENYINEGPAAEIPASIEDIRAEAAHQPLEVSLHQLVSLIAESSPRNEILIAEIFELTEIFAVNKDETTVIRLDPEMLSKILSLLELIGYENPEQSLLDLVARYDLRFLISAMRYLHKLSDPHMRQEFSITTFLKPIVGAVINPLAEIIGKTVMRLLRDSETPRLAY